jgi:hypothetical protein
VGVFVALCTLLVETLLFTFFDDDTFDLHGRSTWIIGVARRNGHEHIQTLDNLTKDTVLVIQMRCGDVGDEEL